MKMFVMWLVGMCRDAALMMGRAAETTGRLFIPCSASAVELGGLMLHNVDVTSSNGEGNEPCYLSLAAANLGSNIDGSDHAGYVVVDVVNFAVVNLVDRAGNSKLRGESVYLNGHYIGIDIDGHVEALKQGLGLYVVKCGTGPLEFYSSMRCRCGCLCASGYWRMEDAQQKAREVGGAAVKITPEYLESFRKALA